MFLILLTRTIVAGTLQLAAVNAPLPVAPSDDDSVRLLRRARSAQASFESVRRANLKREYGGSGGRCDVRIGRFCYWVDDEESEEPAKVPEEPQRIREARTRLLATLDSLAGILPGDGWIAGQRVRYHVEAGDTTASIAAAEACADIDGWCAALAGYAFHAAGAYARADSAFDVALARMPDDARCDWLDLQRVAEDEAADRLQDTPCEERAALTARVLWAATPLFLLGVNDVRTEHLARVVRARIEEHAKPAQALSWGSDVEELMIRYGWPAWYTRTDPAPGSMAEPTIVGHDPTPSFTFFPELSSVDSLVIAPASAWKLKRRVGRSRYAPAYARAFHELPHQVATFRRGDSVLVVAEYDASGDTLLGGSALEGGLFLSPAPGLVYGERRQLGARGALRTIVPRQAMLLSLELLSRDRRAAARVRYGLALGAAANGRGSLDFLLFAPAAGSTRSLEEALERALTGGRLSRSTPLGLYWELYADDAQPVVVSLTMEEVGVKWTRRLARTLHLADRGGPIDLRWKDQPDRGARVSPRVMRLDISRLRPGRYHIRLTVTHPGEPPQLATREVEVTR
jgi:hypothetical protein